MNNNPQRCCNYLEIKTALHVHEFLFVSSERLLLVFCWFASVSLCYQTYSSAKCVTDYKGIKMQAYYLKRNSNTLYCAKYVIYINY